MGALARKVCMKGDERRSGREPSHKWPPNDAHKQQGRHETVTHCAKVAKLCRKQEIMIKWAQIPLSELK